MSFVYKILRKKNIKLNGKKAQGNEKLTKGDQVEVFLSDDTWQKFAGAPGASDFRQILHGQWKAASGCR